MTVTEAIEQLVEKLNSSLTDAGKHERGNHAAGTRLRKALQVIVHDCRDLRQNIQDERNARK